MRTRYVFWHVVVFLGVCAFIAFLLSVSVLAFPLLIAVIDEIGAGNFADGIAYAVGLTLWIGFGLVMGAIIHLCAGAVLERASAIRIAPRVILNPRKENRCPHSNATTA